MYEFIFSWNYFYLSMFCGQIVLCFYFFGCLIRLAFLNQSLLGQTADNSLSDGLFPLHFPIHFFLDFLSLMVVFSFLTRKFI